MTRKWNNRFDLSMKNASVAYVQIISFSFVAVGMNNDHKKLFDIVLLHPYD